ncbi:UDP-N-acetylmuramate--L-alanine ligase [Dermatophilus congolensis]|uniref:UDP-N-acetylmuramate--L-alanine ligase n=1 Tax=Dermatophilus congolensis TaxID=1863 RepID=A0A239VH42_9MICO|nr:UDP-N-acetylmuramate--L-alanine ligase [Dermatophilus congolensis]SNV21216.1 UDP-N-acetylmuramate--L-alanine ligase [Dermatophilus congolensis]
MRPTRFDVTGEVLPVAELGRTHVLAVGGAGMSAVARLLCAAGLSVSGSDAKDSAVLDGLRQAGVDVHVGHDVAHLEGVETVVVSSAIRDDNVELLAARERGLRVLHRSMALASVAKDVRRVAIAGANGKTTTTAMTATLLRDAGVDPSFAVGGDLVATGSNAELGAGGVFVVEADESDGSFLAYRPDVAVVTNVQPDHLDFYGTFEAVQDAYLEFVMSMRPGGLLVTCADDDGALRLAERAGLAGIRVVTYGQSADADVRVDAVEFVGMTSRARVYMPGGGVIALELPLPGLHNVLDAVAALVAATVGLGVSPEAGVAGLAGYGGVRRRFEIKGSSGDVTVIDDYAHNPGKVRALVQTARELVGFGRLVVLFQPHLYSRTRDFAEQFAQGLAPADEVFVLDVYGAREEPMPGVSGRLITEHLSALPGQRGVHFVACLSDAASVVADHVREGDVVLTVGAGDVTTVGPALLTCLADRSV